MRRITARRSRKNHDLSSFGSVSFRTVATLGGVAAVVCGFGLGIILAGAPLIPGSPAPAEDPELSASDPATALQGATTGRGTIVIRRESGETFEHEKNARHRPSEGAREQVEARPRLWSGLPGTAQESAPDPHPAASRSGTRPPGHAVPVIKAQVVPNDRPERLWTAPVPAPSAEGPEAVVEARAAERPETGSGPAAEARAAGGGPGTAGRAPERDGSHRGHPSGRERRREERPRGTQAPPARTGPPAGQAVPPPAARRPAPPAARPPAPPAGRQGPSSPDPCARFDDFRRDYCERLLDDRH